MLTKYLIKKVETCQACKGTGRVQNPVWQEFWNEHPMKFNSTVAELRAWFDEHGDGMTTGIDGLPDEEIFCGECEGAGEIETELDLRQALEEIKPVVCTCECEANGGTYHTHDCALRRNKTT